MADTGYTLLSDDLWQETGAAGRSKELTPLYVERFVGPLSGRNTTWHAHWELIVIAGGSGMMRCDPTFDLVPGVVSLIPPGFRHVEYAPDLLDLFWIGLAGSRVEGLMPNSVQTAHFEDGQRLARVLWDTARTARGLIGPELDGMATVLLNRLLRGIAAEEIPSSRRIEQATEMMRSRLSQDIAISELAAECNCSEGHFYREFRRLTGKTPVRYLTDLRVQEARKWLVHSDLRVSEISERVGFSNAYYFSRVFTHATGFSPSAYRRRSRG